VVLFGSRARGDARPESDWDLLVISEDLPAGHLDRVQLLVGATMGCRTSTSKLAKTPAEFEGYLLPLYLDIALDGQILYDPRGYAAERLGAVRRLIKEAGLYRERTDAGHRWRWKKEPSTPWVVNLGGWRMEGAQGARYRLHLAEHHLDLARRHLSLELWPSTVDDCQVVAENSAKAVLALLAPLARTHDPAKLLHQALREGRFPQAVLNRVERLAQDAERLGPEVHMQVTYGDDVNYVSPWELFGEAHARDYLGVAEEAFRLAGDIVQELGGTPSP
jgi:HEPN domain-containing protein